MRAIPLTKQHVALVDDADFERLSCYRWQALVIGKCVYAVRDGNRVYMHREIMKPNPAQEVDHINGNGLDNTRDNLRLCVHRQNLCNQRKQSGRSSRFKGVCWFKSKRKWTAGIKVNQKRINLGLFKDETEAAMAYDRAAIEHFGEFARTNFPERAVI